MRIGIDARFYQQSGIGRYIRNLLSQLQKLDTKNEYFIFFLKEDFDKIELAPNFHKVLANFHWYGLEEQFKFPGLLLRYKLDLVHFPHFNVPIFYPGKFIVTIHDLIHQNFAMTRASTHGGLVYKIKQLGYQRVLGHGLMQSQKIITVSEFVAKELAKKWYIQDSKIVITPEGVEEDLLKLADKLTKSDGIKILKKFKVTPPYIFYIGNAHPHKNIEVLIETFLILRKKYQYLTLVLGGHDHYFWQKIKNKYGSQKDIIFAGFLTDQELVALYKSAQVFVMPSLEEGFGIPLLEAFACGCPVASSNVASLPEVGGDAALYFNPKDKQDIADKISQILNNSKLRQELIAKGEKRYKQFSWEKLAQKTLEVYTQS